MSRSANKKNSVQTHKKITHTSCQSHGSLFFVKISLFKRIRITPSTTPNSTTEERSGRIWADPCPLGLRWQHTCMIIIYWYDDKTKKRDSHKSLFEWPWRRNKKVHQLEEEHVWGKFIASKKAAEWAGRNISMMNFWSCAYGKPDRICGDDMFWIKWAFYVNSLINFYEIVPKKKQLTNKKTGRQKFQDRKIKIWNNRKHILILDFCFLVPCFSLNMGKISSILLMFFFE